MQLNIKDILTICKGELLYGEPSNSIVSSVSTDSREIAPGALFVPLTGERVDGHDFIAQAVAAGAIATLTEKRNVPPISGKPVIYVPSTRKALMDLAYDYRRLYNVKVIAVTGSAGKTTTKEMIASILSQRYKTKKTIKNYNNDIGLPLSVFQLEPGDEALVLEMGMNHANEITALSKTGAPHIAVITHIGDAHIENFADREGILRAKLEIVDGLHPQGTVILNGDDPLLTSEITKTKVNPFQTRYPDSSNIVQTKPLGLTGTFCHFCINGFDIQFNLPLPGNHMVMNALLAATVGIETGLTPTEIANGLTELELPEGRLSIIHTHDMTIINDAYNANPASMREAIKVLAQHTQRRVCILGDMNELGHLSETRHRELGVFAASAGVDLFITIGTRWLHEGYLSATDRVFSALHFESKEAFLSKRKDILFPGDVVLVKASRGMAFEKIIEGLIS
jgi:UDP-N-acetylmuramoyl-tripeptide--D-alanyl-D-alanine ligase